MTRVTLTLDPELAALLRAAASRAAAHSGRRRSVSSVARQAFAAFLTHGSQASEGSSAPPGETGCQPVRPAPRNRP